MEDQVTFERLATAVATGARVPTETERSQLELAELLRLQAIERDALWALTPEQRAGRAMRGELSRHQRSNWAQRAPEEVPWVNRGLEGGATGIPPWIATTLCDIVDEGDG